MGERYTTLDKLIHLARGNVFAVQAAIIEAAGGRRKADLGGVVRIIVRNNRGRP